ncbi:MAG: UDP-N-acetylmuramoyl-L-alanyl-D-glutamate--2,6-diaminopimelate ligase [Spirochaetaceae bacterium]|jgi:UDP-N-acetylmuramoyl-L-alanyl-D-glutamate--2,6-diaminopimelate ligase|nr:UDP-N-acetylmuramoyl-L-alanyl-D-glutamate--2,6-diaminopimelate ligase [Spirochaetaceae bacterium]
MRHLNDFFSAETGRRAGCVERVGEGNPLVTSLEYDSRRVQPGSLYFALPGLHTDGHGFIAETIARGAAVIVHQHQLEQAVISGASSGGPVFIRVADSRFAMSPIAAAYYNFPAERLVLAGVTGTEGKSTTVYLIWQLLRLAGKKAGFISTVQHSSGGDAEWNAEHQTTPEAPVIHRCLAEMLNNGAEYAVIEASSHGLSPRTNRLGDIAFDTAVMTNVTHEHLEFHGTWEQYRDDKANLFRSLDIRAKINPNSFGVINADDKSAPYFAAATKQKTFTFSAALGKSGEPDDQSAPLPACALPPPDLQLCSIESGAAGNRYKIYSPNDKTSFYYIEDKLPGAFNAGNVLAALLAVSGLLGRPVEELTPLVPALEPVRGRMTAVNRGQPFEVLVDYAHTPSSFMTIFPPLRSRIDQKGGRIISLFGSAGERDTKKRSGQGAIAGRWSDVVILTDEDPRGEDPMAILEEIAAGVNNGEAADKFRREENLFLIPDRFKAMRKAFSLAKGGDLVLLLGKGHENSIIYSDHTVKYDEIAEAEKALDELRKH